MRPSYICSNTPNIDEARWSARASTRPAPQEVLIFQGVIAVYIYMRYIAGSALH